MTKCKKFKKLRNNPQKMRKPDKFPEKKIIMSYPRRTYSSLIFVEKLVKTFLD